VCVCVGILVVVPDGADERRAGCRPRNRRLTGRFIQIYRRRRPPAEGFDKRTLLKRRRPTFPMLDSFDYDFSTSRFTALKSI